LTQISEEKNFSVGMSAKTRGDHIFRGRKSGKLDVRMYDDRPFQNAERLDPPHTSQTWAARQTDIFSEHIPKLSPAISTFSQQPTPRARVSQKNATFEPALC
jgi:hypothetical protein